MGRRLAPEEKALWGRVMATVKPLHPVVVKPAGLPKASAVEIRHPAPDARSRFRSDAAKKAEPPFDSMPRQALRTGYVKHGVTGSKIPVSPKDNLDSTWDRRIHKGAIIPDISVDLHETTLSAAYARLDRALDQAIHQKLRVILLVTGKARAHDRASGTGRGAIAAVVRDWLAASRHSAHISAVRQAHPRHGGDGALYIVLKR
jgi:DNA-nicking Smr family endonuclease